MLKILLATHGNLSNGHGGTITVPLIFTFPIVKHKQLNKGGNYETTSNNHNGQSVQCNH